MPLANTGERFLPGTGGISEIEHLHRYRLALHLATGLDVLDVASGEGYGSNLLAEVARSVTGVDISNAAIHSARKKYQKPNLRFEQGDCVQLPLESASVDLVVSFETIEHHDQHEAMLREIRRILRPGGVLLISSPNRPEYNRTLDAPNPYHVKELDYQEFVDLLKNEFAHLSIYGQHQINGSVIFPYPDSQAIKPASFPEPQASDLQSLVEPVYFLALASDAELPVLPATALPNALPEDNNQSITNLDVMLYLSETVAGKPTFYNQLRSLGEGYLLDGQRKKIDLSFPEDLAPLASLRLDIASAPVAIYLHKFALLDAKGKEQWSWNRDCAVFINLKGMIALPQAKGACLLCVDDDPQAELSIPAEILRVITAGSYLHLEFTPRPLLEVLPGVLKELHSAAVKHPGVLQPVGLPRGFAAELGVVAELTKKQIDCKNTAIAAQQAEIEALQAREQLLHKQIVRAEAQLDLLKELTLTGIAERLL